MYCGFTLAVIDIKIEGALYSIAEGYPADDAILFIRQGKHIIKGERYAMDWDFGLTMMVLGMSATFLTLYLLGWVIRLLVKLFPEKEPEGKKQS